MNNREFERELAKGLTKNPSPLRFEFATGMRARMKGLLDPAICERGETLVLIPCKSIHTFGMTEAIDVAFVDRRGRVLDVVRGLPPRRVLSCQRATCVLERRSAACGRWVEQGEAMTFMAGAAGSEWL